MGIIMNKQKYKISYCIECIYYKPLLPVFNRAPIGECHRFPQEVKVYSSQHWCGEFKRRRK